MRPEDLSWAGPGRSPLRPGVGAPVTVRWLGTAGFEIEHAGSVLLFDPYLTRASLLACARGAVRSDGEACARELPRASAIVLGHTHFDHALDAPGIARRTGARVFGSRSAAALCRAAGLEEAQVECVEPSPGGTVAPVEREVGPFRLRFWPSAHSRFMFGRIPFEGDIADCDQVPTGVSAYKCGAVFAVEVNVAGRRLFHLGSAELVEAGWRVPGCDLVMACVAGWTSTDRYPERLVAALSPGAVLLHHWDNFFTPLARGARALPAMRLPHLVDRLQRAAPGLPVGTLPILGKIST